MHSKVLSSRFCALENCCLVFLVTLLGATRTQKCCPLVSHHPSRPLTQTEWHGEYFDFSGAISDALPERGQRAAFGGAADAFHALALGCGNSKLSSQLLENEKRVALVTSVDYSPRVIDDMRARHADHPQAASLRWEATDVRDMRALFADESIDVIVDKACVDALSCSDGFDSQKLGLPAVAAECARILAPGGGWLVVSFNQPSIMLPLLERPEWDVAHRSQRGNVHLYTARKH